MHRGRPVSADAEERKWLARMHAVVAMPDCFLSAWGCLKSMFSRGDGHLFVYERRVPLIFCAASLVC